MPGRNKILYLIIPAFLLLASCNEGGSVFSSRPAGVLSKKAMVDLLVDMHLTEAFLRSSARTDSLHNIRDISQKKYQSVFETHHITANEFTESLDYYLLNIDELDEIYTEVLNRLTEMQAETQGSQAGQKRSDKPAQGDTSEQAKLPVLKDSIKNKSGQTVVHPDTK